MSENFKTPDIQLFRSGLIGYFRAEKHVHNNHPALCFTPVFSAASMSALQSWTPETTRLCVSWRVFLHVSFIQSERSGFDIGPGNSI